MLYHKKCIKNEAVKNYSLSYFISKTFFLKMFNMALNNDNLSYY